MEKIQVVLASPSDLKEERKMIKEYVDSLNPMYLKEDVCIDLRMWEDSSPGMNVDGPQGLIDDELGISTSDIFICMFWKKIGTKLPNQDVTGTEHELNLALDSYRKHRKPDIKLYLKSDPDLNNEDFSKEINRVIKKIQDKGLYSHFNSIDELKEHINKVIQTAVMKRINNKMTIVPEIHNYFEVFNSQEFVDNLKSNNKLVLNTGYYDILSFDSSNENVKKEEVFDGKELVVSNLSNITIVGDNSILLAKPRYANVINFYGCSNIKLTGLTLGHTPEKGYCAGSVLRFQNCKDIKLESLELFGCGTYGIELYNCSNIRVNGTKIFECSYGALNIVQSNVEFSNSMIYDCNKTADNLINAQDSQLDFNNVSIFNNHIDTYLISLDSSMLFCTAVCIYSNSYAKLCNEEIPFGIYLEENIENGESDYYVTISSTEKIELEEYQEIKEKMMQVGKIIESVFENGDMNIFVRLPSFEAYDEAITMMKYYGNVEIETD